MDTSLWRFSVSIYGQPGVSAECLSLQDRFGVNVNVLLFCTYVASEFGALLTCEDIAAADRAVSAWQTQVVQVLRKLRRRLKQLHESSESSHSPAIDALRIEIENAELEAERIEAAMLSEWCKARRRDWPCGEREVAVTNNCKSVLAHFGAEPPELPRRLIEQALASK